MLHAGLPNTGHDRVSVFNAARGILLTGKEQRAISLVMSSCTPRRCAERHARWCSAQAQPCSLSSSCP